MRLGVHVMLKSFSLVNASQRRVVGGCKVDGSRSQHTWALAIDNTGLADAQEQHAYFLPVRHTCSGLFTTVWSWNQRSNTNIINYINDKLIDLKSSSLTDTYTSRNSFFQFYTVLCWHLVFTKTLTMNYSRKKFLNLLQMKQVTHYTIQNTKTRHTCRHVDIVTHLVNVY